MLYKKKTICLSMSRGRARRKNKLVAPISREEKPEWVTLSEDDVKKIILDLARKETSLSRIGIILRDDCGIPDIKLITGKSLKKTLEDYKIKTKLPDDLRDLMVGALNIREHYEKNKNDKTALKGLQNTEARIRSLASYYVKKGVLPKNWRYNPQRAKLLLGR